METTHPTTAVRRAFGKVKILVAVYGLVSVLVLVTVVVLASVGRPVTSFMWGRSGGVLAGAVVAYWLTVMAARGARWAYLRMRIISVVMPIAIIAIDTVPGVLPMWFVLMQAACALAIGAAAFIINGPTLRSA